MTEVLLPEGWPRPVGYANGVAARGRLIFVAGQVGWNTASVFADGLLPQVRQALENVVAVLRAGGAEPRHLVRLTWYVVDRETYRVSRSEIGRVYREVIGSNYPAMTLVQVASLLEDRALVEIEATAVVPEDGA
ncbi:MAG: RidA family protein [Chloroflexi bacterium]|nr:RidA family protein [Chloroflexota bacterium]MBV9597865.1 RidA family protein [Chloroflexota bacterium]